MEGRFTNSSGRLRPVDGGRKKHHAKSHGEHPHRGGHRGDSERRAERTTGVEMQGMAYGRVLQESDGRKGCRAVIQPWHLSVAAPAGGRPASSSRATSLPAATVSGMCKLRGMVVVTPCRNIHGESRQQYNALSGLAGAGAKLDRTAPWKSLAGPCSPCPIIAAVARYAAPEHRESVRGELTRSQRMAAQIPARAAGVRPNHLLAILG